MKMGKKVKNFIATVIVCSALITGRPAHAWLWPTIDITQISTFVSSITQCIGQVATATAQIKNYTETIHAIGDQVSSIAQYVTDLKNEISKIISLVNEITTSITYGVHTIDSILQDIEAQVSGMENQEEEIADEVEEDIEEEIDDEETDEEDVQKTLNEALEETKKAQEETAATIKQAEGTISTITDQANASIDNLMSSILNDELLSEEQQNELKQEAEDVKTQISDLENHANEVLNKMENDLNEENKNIIDAYADYSKGIGDYYNQEITREELTAKGEEFKENISSADSSVNKDELNGLFDEVNSVVEAVDNLKEDISNGVANNKDYSDEEIPQEENKADQGDKVSINDKMEKKIQNISLANLTNHTTYVFSFHSDQTHQHAKGIAKKLKTGYYGVDQDFLLSRELVCDKNAKLDDLADKPEKGIEWFKDCVIKAKTEKEYWCPNASDEKAIAQCDPFKLSKGLYKKKYKNEGVYKHLFEDYSMANIVGLNKIKQYATTWQDLSNKESTLSTLQDQFSKIDNTRNAYALQSIIDLESPQLWSRLRRIDSLERAKDVINYYRQQPTLYLDGRQGNEDYSDAQKEEPGTLEIDVGDGKTEDKTIMSHVMLHLCGLKAKDISIDPKKKGTKEEGKEIEKAEGKIKDCMFKYANLATRGGDAKFGNIEAVGQSGERTRSRDDVMKEWRGKEIKTLTDSMFHTLYMATVNNFRSSKDYAKLSDGEVNIVSIQKGIKKAKEARDDYSSGAQNNYYSAQQILTVIDADAQSLQTEIIRDIASMSYNFFDTVDDGGEK